MTTIVIPAIYRDGVLHPQTRIDLPDNTPVEIQVTPVSRAASPAASLFGAFPQLGALPEDDFAWAKRMWEHGLERQSRALDEPN